MPVYPGKIHGICVALTSSMERVDSHLRFVDAGHLTTPFGSLDGAELIGRAHNSVGRLDGVLIDPLERRVRFFVMESRGWFTRRHYLVRPDTTRVEPEGKALLVDVDSDDLHRLPEVEPESLQAFSDEDLVSAIFATPDRG
jgi:PRC-barrel domain